MKFKMKRKYIIPEMNVESFSASSSSISGSDGDGLTQCSKQFDAWSSWDE